MTVRDGANWREIGFAAGIGVLVLLSALILSFNEVFPGLTGDTPWVVGMVVSNDIRAPFSRTYVSDVLTERRRDAARAEISAIYEPPDPNVARQQIALLTQILEFIEDVRADPFGTVDQKIADIDTITALTLTQPVANSIVTIDNEIWNAVRGEMALVLERVMRESMREIDLPQILDQLPTQVSVRFDAQNAALVTAFVRDLVRPNRFPNADATLSAQQSAADTIAPESRSFERGQIIVRAGVRIDDADYEALRQFDLLQSPDRRWEALVRALLASCLVFASFGLYLLRAAPRLVRRRGFLLLLGSLFVMTLLGGRVFNGVDGQIFAYPAAGLALVFVAVAGVDIAMLAMIGLAFLIGTISDNSLEIASLIGAGGVIGALSLRRVERLNSFFFAGVVVACVNFLIVLIFNLGIGQTDGAALPVLLIYALIGGVLSGMTALAVLYLITLIFNLPTNLKLVELSQPSQPLLQRLLREAPGTYQHSLQVANLCEQAANAIGANASLVRVAALYHDIGKILNPAFFIENQVDNVNPHDMLNDPYRSADLIISHVVDGDKLARQYRLPERIRDFICEHHGTTLVSYFYNAALQQADDPDSIDAEQFTYPGPKPRSRETAILMLADSCESTVRANKPSHKGEIAEIVARIFDMRARDAQLDDSGLTLNDLTEIRGIFIDMLSAVFHPRIQYPATALGQGITPILSEPAARRAIVTTGEETLSLSARPVMKAITGETTVDVKNEAAKTSGLPTPPVLKPEIRYNMTQEVPAAIFDDDDSPLADVPPLRRRDETGDHKIVKGDDNA